MIDRVKLSATASSGLEAIVAREVKALGYLDVSIENGRVHYQTDALGICRSNLWLRSADRVLIELGRFPATTFDELFEGTKALPWAEWLPADVEFPVNGRSQKSMLSSVPACQAIVKKAVVEKLKERYQTEWFAENGPRGIIEVSIFNDVATLTLDTSGIGLHKRGYRRLITEAPLKETMAAALVQLSRWRSGRPLHDPFCGSGTIVIEAAMIGWNLAPGLRRTFDAEAWGVLPGALWEQAREEAYDLVRDDEPLEIFGSDIEQEAIDVALAAAKASGLTGQINFHKTEVKDWSPSGEYGCLITNPPYGERIGTFHDAERVIRQLGSIFQKMDTWSAFVLSPDKSFERIFGRQADKKRKLYNGRIECALLQYLGPLPPRH